MSRDALLAGCSARVRATDGCSGLGRTLRDLLSRDSVDDAKAVTFRVRKDDEVWICRVVPHHASGAEPDQPLDLIGLFVGIIDHEVDVKSWTFLGRGGRSMHGNASSLTRRWHEDREAILGRREPNGPVAKDARPERNCSVHVIGTEHHGAESNHHLSLTRRPDPVLLGLRERFR